MLILKFKELERRIDETLDLRKIVAISVNQEDDIIVLGILNPGYSPLSYLVRVSQEGTELSRLTFDVRDPNDFAIYEDKYFICGRQSIIGINDAGSVFLRLLTDVFSPLGICIGGQNNDLFINETVSANYNCPRSVMRISVFSTAGLLKKRVFHELGRRTYGSPRMLSNGSIVVAVKLDNAVYEYNPFL